MIYIYIDKQTRAVLAFGSLVALCDATGLKKDRFYTHFGRKKNTSFDHPDFQIFKTDIKRSKHDLP